MCPFHVGAHLVAHQHRRPALGQATHDQLVAMLMMPTCLRVGVGVGVRVWGLGESEGPDDGDGPGEREREGEGRVGIWASLMPRPPAPPSAVASALASVLSSGAAPSPVRSKSIRSPTSCHSSHQSSVCQRSAYPAISFSSPGSAATVASTLPRASRFLRAAGRLYEGSGTLPSDLATCLSVLGEPLPPSPPPPPPPLSLPPPP